MDKYVKLVESLSQENLDLQESDNKARKIINLLHALSKKGVKRNEALAHVAKKANLSPDTISNYATKAGITFKDASSDKKDSSDNKTENKSKSGGLPDNIKKRLDSLEDERDDYDDDEFEDAVVRPQIDSLEDDYDDYSSNSENLDKLWGSKETLKSAIAYLKKQYPDA